jgi:hypothetical protein
MEPGQIGINNNSAINRLKHPNMSHIRIKIEDIKQEAISRGGLCLSDEYIPDVKLKFQCADGHIWETICSTFKTGKWWCQNGKAHRLDGPPPESTSGDKQWYVGGKHIVCKTQEEFEKLLKLKAFW